MAEAFHAVPLKHQHPPRRLANDRRPARSRRSANHADRILLIRPDHLGDVLLTTPAIRALRAAHPNAEIHALVGPWSASVLANFSELDVILTLPFPGFSRREKTQPRLALPTRPRIGAQPAPHRLRHSHHLPPRSLVGRAADASRRNPSAHRLQSARCRAVSDRSHRAQSSARRLAERPPGRAADRSARAETICRSTFRLMTPTAPG